MMVSLVPPILFQRRVIASENTSLECNDDVVSEYNARHEIVRERKCQLPYKCESEYKPLECVPSEGNSPERFFGQTPVPMGAAKVMFPEFAWTLETEVVVRDGEQLRPDEDYLDTSTVELWYFTAFYVPSSRIATIVACEFDLSEIRIGVNVKYHQIAVLSEAQFRGVVAWAVAGIAMAVLSILLAVPAAILEVKEFLEEHRDWLKEMHLRRVNPTSVFDSPLAKKRSYSLNTTQPDVFDVVLNVAMVALLSSFLLNQKENHDKLTDTLAEIAGLDWASDQSFNAKVAAFLLPVEQAVQMVQREEDYLNAAFWMLCFCLVRMIIYMKFHPSISSITETFISVGRELVNFLFSFALIFFFLAFIAHVRFGSMYDEFETISQSLITQFSLLIGDSSPDYRGDTLMCIYVVSYVFVCTLSFLNFLLAIVVNGYTGVTERILENKVARSFLQDVMAVPIDLVVWLRHPTWPSKLQILIAMQDKYPFVFEDEDEVVCLMTRGDFHACIEQASEGKASEADTDALFYRYGRMKVLVLRPSDLHIQDAGSPTPAGVLPFM
mmetsp:Transcript_26182/g.73392  ORF Transcript_26182/g.73392 Transcript_26182/m.73392 type:complete len:553 (-) Transcript_26182:215-1873(-)